MSLYNRKSFDNCPFNPYTGGKMTETYPILCDIIDPEFAKDGLQDTIIRYTIAIYEPKSPLVIGERDLNYRKSLAAEMFNLPIEQEDTIQAIYNCTYPYIVDFTIRYLTRFVRSKEWAAICATEFKYWEAIKLIMQPIAADKSDREQLDAANKKDVLSASIDQSLLKLEEYYKTFFGEDPDLHMRAKKRLSPELMAGKIT